MATERGAGMTKVSWDQVLAFRIERHFLNERVPRAGLLDVVSALCGVQAQVASSAELVLWARVESLEPGEVDRAFEEERTLVRTWTIRDTVHLIPAADLPLYVAVLRPLPPERIGRGWFHQREITREQYQRIIENVPRALDRRPRTRERLADRLVELAGPDVREAAVTSWGGVLKMSARLGDLCFGPPQGRNITFVRPDRWLRRRLPVLDPDVARREFMRRVLGTYGVAGYQDLRLWLESTRIAKELLQTSRDELVEVDVEGRPGWAHERDLEELTARRRPSGLSLLPGFDPYLLAPRPREPFVAAAHMARVFRRQGRVSPVVLVDGRAAGVWSHELHSGQLRVEVEPFVELRPRDRKALSAEVERLAAFLGGTPELSLSA